LSESYGGTYARTAAISHRQSDDESVPVKPATADPIARLDFKIRHPAGL
jgi:hypothetical protein